MGVPNDVRARSSAALVERRRLLDALDAWHAGVRCVGIWAPAGSGKTALLRQWMDSGDGVCFFADGSDEDDAIDAIARARSATTGPVHLAVDRMDAAAPRVRDAVTALIDDESSEVRVILAGRFDPLPASPARWSVTREIREADLAFTVDEAGELLRDGALGPTDDQLERILNRTGGWTAALVLLRRLLDGRDADAVIEHFDGDTRPVAEYLVAEFLQRLSPQDHEVLVWSAVAPVVPVGLAASLTGHSAIGTVLDELVRTNSLVTRDGESYVFHPILATFLGAEQRRRDIVRAARGHAQAAAWFEERGDLRDALDQRVRAEDSSALADFIARRGHDLVFGGHSGTLVRALRHVPQPARDRLDARVGLLLDLPHFADREAARRRRDRLPHPDTDTDVVDRIVDALLAHAEGLAEGRARLRDGGIRSDAARTPAGAMLLDYALAWTSSAGDDEQRLRTAERLVAIGAGTDAAELRWLRLLALESALSLVAGSTVWVDVVPVFIAIGRDLISDADVTDSVSARAVFAHAAQAFHRAEPLPRATLVRLGSTGGAAMDPAMQHIARTIVALDDVDRIPGTASLTTLTRVVEDELTDHPMSLAYAVVPWLHAALWHGDTALADRIVSRSTRVLGASALETLTATFLRRPAPDTEHVLRSALEQGAVKISPLTLSYAWTALAVHAEKHGRTSIATSDIINALLCAAPLDAVRPFLQEGGAPAELLRSRGDRLGERSALVSTVLARSTPPDGEPGGSISLTPKERDLLRELPAHQSISEIAGSRHVSPNTIKSQVRSIYGKLGVQNRADAVTRARRLGLL